MNLPTIPARQLEILQHSLGVDKYGQGPQYRNHFVTPPDGKDGRDCVALVEAGLMKDHGPQSLAGGMHCYCVTPKGVDVVAFKSPIKPKVSRSRARYLRYLEIGDCFEDFRSFLLWDSLPEWEKDERRNRQEAQP